MNSDSLPLPLQKLVDEVRSVRGCVASRTAAENRGLSCRQIPEANETRYFVNSYVELEIEFRRKERRETAIRRIRGTRFPLRVRLVQRVLSLGTVQKDH